MVSSTTTTDQRFAVVRRLGAERFAVDFLALVRRAEPVPDNVRVSEEVSIFN